MNTPENHRKRWNESDDAKLRMMIAHGTPTNEIARQLKRTPGTVNWRWWHLRIMDANDEMNDLLARETSVILPEHDETLPPLPEKKKPIAMVERRLFWGLLTITRFEYADDDNVS